MTARDVVKVNLPYLKAYRDRHGRARYYFRRKGRPAIALPAPTDPDFMNRYGAALDSAPAPKIDRLREGTIARLVADYYASPAYARLAPSSQATYRQALNPFIEQHGDKRVAALAPRHAEKIIGEIGSRAPAMANLTRAVLRKVMRHAIKIGLRSDNPFIDVDRYRLGSRHTWTDAELAAYEARWSVGTRERLAYELLLCTGQRGSDVVNMRRPLAAEIVVRPQKTERSTGKELTLALLDRLSCALDAYPVKGLHLIGDKAGRRISRRSLTRLIREAVKDAGLPARCTAHGLRKSLMRRLAEHGATAKQIQAISGHATLAEVQRYTEAADQKRLAADALALLKDEGGTTGV